MFVQVGDKVEITIPAENREWGYKPCDDGTVAEVISFTESYWGRLNGLMKPGVYVNDCWAKVKSEDGKEWVENTGRLKVISDDPNLIENRRNQHFAKSFAERAALKFIRDLPDTHIWEGDTVITPKPLLTDKSDGMVVGIEWNWENRPFRVSEELGAGWYSYFQESELVLKERGDCWKYYHNEPLSFADLKDEANFYKRLGLCEELPNPKTDLFSWTLEEVLEQIALGYVDCMAFQSGLFGTGPHLQAYKFNDRDLGRRVAAMTLRDFNRN